MDTRGSLWRRHRRHSHDRPPRFSAALDHQLRLGSAANLAADLDAWTRLLGLYGHDDLALAEPDIMRYRLLHLPAKLTRHARRATQAISRHWPWRQAFLTCWNRLTDLAALACPPSRPPQPQKGRPAPLRSVEPVAAAATREGPSLLTRGMSWRLPDHTSDYQPH